MTDLTILIAVLALSIWPGVLLLYSRKKHKEIMDKLSANDWDDVSTQDLVLEVLRQIGCQPTINEEKHICFKYQGSEFYIATLEDSRFIAIWNPWWGSIETDNAAFPYLKEIINLVNVDALVTTVYTTDEDGKSVGLHSKCQVLFTPKEAPLDDYLKDLLDSFFATHEAIKDNFKQLNATANEQEKEQQTRVQVKGFASYKENSPALPIDAKE